MKLKLKRQRLTTREKERGKERREKERGKERRKRRGKWREDVDFGECTLSPWVKTRRESEEKGGNICKGKRSLCVGLLVSWFKRSPNSPPLARINVQGDIGQDTSAQGELIINLITSLPPFPRSPPLNPMRFVGRPSRSCQSMAIRSRKINLLSGYFLSRREL